MKKMWSKKNKVFAMLLTAVLIMNFYIIINQSMNNTTTDHFNSKIPTVLTKNKKHDPIKIDGDAGLNDSNGVTYDSTNDIYYISSWNIDGGGYGYGIYVANITKILIIDYCEVYNVSGGNYSMPRSNAGIFMYNISNYTCITDNYIHNTDSAGVYLYEMGQYGNLTTVDNNNIYLSKRAGIYVSTSENVTAEDNVIFHNDVGIHYYKVKNSHIHENGIGENTHEGIRIGDDKNVYISSNRLYHNNGSGDTYNSSHIQVTEDSSSTEVTWDTNYWHDWAMNNDSNWHYLYGIPYLNWEYHIVDSNGNFVTHDFSPVKVLRVYNPSSVKFETDAGGEPLNISGKFGVVSGTGNQSAPYKIVGIEYNLTNEKQDVIYAMGGTYVEFINVWIHNGSTSNGASGNGLDIVAGYGVKLTHVNIYNCTMYGVNISWGPVEINNSYIHDNELAGINMVGDAAGNGWSDVYLSNSTVVDNTWDGIIINYSGPVVHISHSIIASNGYAYLYHGDGIYISPYYNPTVTIENNSVFNNAGYGVYIDNETDHSTTIKLTNNIFHGNNGATQTYNSSRTQVYLGSGNDVITTDHNFYNDWVYGHQGKKLWINDPYPFNGSGQDKKPARWINFTQGKIYIDKSVNNYYPYHGTEYGIIGYDGYEYWIEGWNVKTAHNYHGMDIENLESTIEISGCNVSNVHGVGMYLYNLSHHIYVWYNLVSGNDLEGIDAIDTPYISIAGNDISHNEYNGIFLADIDHGFPSVVNNKIYRNYDYGVYLKNINGISSYSAVDYNQIYINYGGIEGDNISVIKLIQNGIAYNEKNYYGLYLHNSHDVTIINNTFYENNGSGEQFNSKYIQAYDDGSNYWNNTHGGNYWHDWAVNNDTNDANGDWIVDYAYSIDGGAKDHKPYLYREHLPFRINNPYEMTYDNGVIGGDGSYLYPFVIAGWRVNGHNYGYGMYIGNFSGYPGETIINHCVVSNADGGAGNDYYHNVGIIIYNYEPNALNDYIVVNNTDSGYNGYAGIRTEWCRNVDIGYGNFSNNGGHGLWIQHTTYATIHNVNTSSNHYEGIFVYESGADITNSTIYNNSAHGIELSSSWEGGSIHDNIIKENNEYGINITKGGGDTKGFVIYHNQFIGNNGASEDGTYDPNHIQAYDDTTQYNNLWNLTNGDGNCWSDNSTTDAYSIDGGSSKDYSPGCAFVPELNMVIMVFAMLGVIAVALYRKKH